MTLRASNIANQGTEGRDQENRAAAPAIGDGPPEDGRDAEHYDLSRRQVTRVLDGPSERHAERLIRRDDRSGDQRSHHGVKGEHEQIYIFLRVGSASAGSRLGAGENRRHTFHAGQLYGSAGSEEGRGCKSTVPCLLRR